tara:strand:+ start:14720 stop:16876 length:2157 start_codon:yes stop_codon:yes gene_type:complete
MAKKGKLDMQFVVDTSKPAQNIKELQDRIETLRDTIEGAPLGSAEFEQLTGQLSNASSEMKVLEKNMEGLEPQQKAEAFLKMGEGIAGAFAVGQGAMALMGVESESMEKLQVKVQSAIAIATGIRMMSEAALMAGIAKRVIVEKLAIAQTKVSALMAGGAAIATKLWAVAQGVLTGSIGVSTIALHVLKAAIISTGIGALVVVIASLIGMSGGWSKAIKTNTDDLVKLGETTLALNKNIENEIQLKNKLTDATSEEAKEIILLQEKYKENTAALDDLNVETERNVKNLKKLKAGHNFNEASQNYILRMGPILDKNSATRRENLRVINDQIRALEQKIVTDGKEAAELERIDAENKQKEADRRSRGKARRTQKESDAKSLRKLEEELLLLEVQDTEERAQLKREQDLANELSDAKNIRDKTIRLETLANIQDIYDQKELNRLQKIEDEKQKIIDDAAAEKIKADKEAQDEIDKTTDAYFEEIRRKNLENRAREIEDANKHFDEMMLAEGLTGDEKMKLLIDHQETIKGINDVYDEEDLAKEDEINAQKLDAIMQLADAFSANMNARLTELDNAMNRELEMEGLTQEQKKTINEKYQKKKDKIAARQKAIQASQAIINTFVGATRAVADLGPIAGPIAAGAIVLGGLASVRQIYAQDVGGGGGGGGGDAPDVESTSAPKTGSFTLSGEADKQDTIKAYVVTDEVTDSQSQLEDIRQQATI